MFYVRFAVERDNPMNNSNIHSVEGHRTEIVKGIIMVNPRYRNRERNYNGKS